MKSAVICGSCGTLTRAALTYKVRVTTEGAVFVNERGDKFKAAPQSEVKHICPACARRAGYKVRREKVSLAETLERR